MQVPKAAPQPIAKPVRDSLAPRLQSLEYPLTPLYQALVQAEHNLDSGHLASCKAFLDLVELFGTTRPHYCALSLDSLDRRHAVKGHIDGKG